MIASVVLITLLLAGCSSANRNISESEKIASEYEQVEEEIQETLYENETSSEESDAVGEVEETDTLKPPNEEIAYEVTNIVNEISDLQYGDSKTFSVIIEVNNTGEVPIYLDDCILDYEDNDGHLLQTYDYMSKVPDIIQPNEKGYFYTNGRSKFDSDVIFDNGCNLIPTITVSKAQGELVRHEVTDTSIYESYGSVGCKGRIVNETDDEIGIIYVTIVYYGHDGNVLAISGTNVTDIKANGKTSFDCAGIMMRDITVDEVADYRVYADEMYFQL